MAETIRKAHRQQEQVALTETHLRPSMDTFEAQVASRLDLHLPSTAVAYHVDMFLTSFSVAEIMGQRLSCAAITIAETSDGKWFNPKSGFL